MAVYSQLLDFSARLAILEGGDERRRELERKLSKRLRFWQERRRGLSARD